MRPIREEERPEPRNELLLSEEVVWRAPRFPVMRERLRGAKVPWRSAERLFLGVRPNEREDEDLRFTAASLLVVPRREDAVSLVRPRLPLRSPPPNRRQSKLLLREVTPEVSKRLVLDRLVAIVGPERELLGLRVRADVELPPRAESTLGKPRLSDDEEDGPDRRERFPVSRVLIPLASPNCRQPGAALELRTPPFSAPEALDDVLVRALDPLVATLSAD